MSRRHHIALQLWFAAVVMAAGGLLLSPARHTGPAAVAMAPLQQNTFLAAPNTAQQDSQSIAPLHIAYRSHTVARRSASSALPVEQLVALQLAGPVIFGLRAISTLSRPSASFLGRAPPTA